MKVSIKILDGVIVHNEALKMFLDQNEDVPCELRTLKGARTLTQNGFYWLFLEVIADETGNNVTDLHEYFKVKLLPPRLVKIKGKAQEHEIEVPQSTTGLDKASFADYLDRICALTGVPLPDKEAAGFIKN